MLYHIHGLTPTIIPGLNHHRYLIRMLLLFQALLFKKLDHFKLKMHEKYALVF